MAAAAAMINRKNRSLGYQRSYRSNYQEDDDGPNLCWMLVFGVCGVTLIGFGAWYAYDSFEDPRIVALRPYNHAIGEWNGHARTEFAQTIFEWRLVSPTPEKVTIQGNCTDDAGTVPSGCLKTHEVMQFKNVDPAASNAPWTKMVAAMITEPLARDQNMEGITAYEPLRWVGTGVLPASLPGRLEPGSNGVTAWTGGNYKLQLRARSAGKETVFDIETIQPLKETPVAANLKMCRLHHGNNFHDHRCWDRVAISQVCLRLNHTSDGWKAPEDMQRGCAAGTELSFARSCPGSAAMGRGQMSDDPGCDFSQVNFTVRSLEDPHTVAMSLTHGTLNFGYTPHENWVTGLIMMCVGGVLLCPVAPVVCMWLSQKRSRHSQYMTNDSIFERRPAYDRTVTQSPSPSQDSGATDDDYRVDIQSHSRTASKSPRRRRGTSKDAVPSGTLLGSVESYAVPPSGHAVELLQVDLEMQGNTEQEVVMGVPVIREHPKQRSRLGLN
mmetsp:Transcript_68927/g.111834  ORF Transcript_68927/g.111834 Transcript_68927/m.111834 type:complete len:496 (-) Transcript_68927:317-1804(-)